MLPAEISVSGPVKAVSVITAFGLAESDLFEVFDLVDFLDALEKGEIFFWFLGVKADGELIVNFLERVYLLMVEEELVEVIDLIRRNF